MVEFLHKKGFADITEDLNQKLTDEQYNLPVRTSLSARRLPGSCRTASAAKPHPSSPFRRKNLPSRLRKSRR